MNVYVVENPLKLRRKSALRGKKKTECSKISAEAVCKCCKVHNEMAQLKSIEAAGCDDCAKYAEHVPRKNESRQCNEQDKMLSEKSTDGKTCFYSLDLQKVRMLPEIASVKSAYSCNEYVHTMKVSLQLTNKEEVSCYAMAPRCCREK